MLINTLKQLPVALALTTGAGILMHDTQIDQAALTHISQPASSFNSSTAGRMFKFDDFHVHSERPDYRGGGNTIARSQTRLSDEKKYIIQKRLAGSNNDFDYIWPSI